MRHPPWLVGLLSVALMVSGCGGGSSGSSGSSPGTPPPPMALYTVPPAESLSTTDVEKVISQSVAEASARGTPAVIAVTDRVGNVLAVYAMVGAPQTLTIRVGPSGRQQDIGLQGFTLPQPPSSPSPAVPALAAIAKAVTGAYLSSDQDALSTRTASEIVQTTFPPSPQANGLGSGPLYGVQFSSLPCSDLAQRFSATAPPAMASIGPKRSPLGLAADPGGFPLYKNGVLAGGVGVKVDTDYGLDPNIDQNNPQQVGEEAVALAGTIGFDAPTSIQANQITVNGTSLIYSDATASSLLTNPATAPGYNTLPAGLVAVPGYAAATVIPGQVYGTEASGVRKSTTGEFDNPDAFILSDGSGHPRYPIRGGTDAVASPLTSSEVTTLLQQAFSVMSETRAQIRQPLNSRAQVTISVVDTNGAILGMVSSPDPTLFGVDVSLQKARTAMFFSAPFAAFDLAGDADMASVPAVKALDLGKIGGYVEAFGNFLNISNPLAGATAFSARSIGNLERPQFPDGEVGGPNGPFSPPISLFNPFDTGLQSDFIQNYLLPPSSACGSTSLGMRLANGIQIFPGGVPIYRGNVLIGGIGVSGDGVNQDDLISFLGLANAGGTIQNAPAAIRADQLLINQGGGVNRLLYVQCPVAPFLNSNDQNPCEGK